MRKALLIFPTVLLLAPTFAARAQEPSQAPPTGYTRPRVVNRTAREEQQAQTKPTPGDAQQAPAAAPATTRPQQPPTPAPTAQPSPAQTPAATAPASTTTTTTTTAPPAPTIQPAVPYVPLQPARPLASNKARTKIAEAQRMLRSRLTLTAASSPSLEFVTVAALEHETNEIHFVTLPKQTFLTRGTDVSLSTSKGLPVRLQVVRSNYVNTAVVVSDAKGRQLAPLVVEYPIEKFGRFREMAYYTSAHPALVSPEVSRRGREYVRNMLDLAAKRLKEKGKIIAPEIVDIAERLSIVEHVDHDRFRREDRAALYNEVYALFALNELDTYRYSVSSAGAGGMVQMIPSTYAMVRRMHPGVGLNPDFVAGMRNHGNALEAMLLYMQDTWNGLALNQEVLDAMRNNYATQPELASAGYNSNPARLPLYLRRGGAAWRTLIPRETQMYLQIYKSFESLIPLKTRGDDDDADKDTTGGTQ